MDNNRHWDDVPDSQWCVEAEARPDIEFPDWWQNVARDSGTGVTGINKNLQGIYMRLQSSSLNSLSVLSLYEDGKGFSGYQRTRAKQNKVRQRQRGIQDDTGGNSWKRAKWNVWGLLMSSERWELRKKSEYPAHERQERQENQWEMHKETE